MLTKNSPSSSTAPESVASDSTGEGIGASRASGPGCLSGGDVSREGTIEDCRGSDTSKRKEAPDDVLRNGTIDDCRSSNAPRKVEPSDDPVRGG